MSFKNSLRSSLGLLPLLSLITIAAQPATAQIATGTLTGTIHDQTGAILPNVMVTATNTDRNTSQTTKTNLEGRFVLPALSPGNYSLAADLPGFRKFVQAGIVLQVDQVARVDMHLDV